MAVHRALMFYVNQTLQRLYALPSGSTLPVIMNISTFMAESIIPITKPIVVGSGGLNHCMHHVAICSSYEKWFLSVLSALQCLFHL